MTRLERDVGISVETLAIFVRFWLATTPALPEPAALAARAKAGERCEAFIAALGCCLAKGPKLRQEISTPLSEGFQVAFGYTLAFAALMVLLVSLLAALALPTKAEAIVQ